MYFRGYARDGLNIDFHSSLLTSIWHRPVWKSAIFTKIIIFSFCSLWVNKKVVPLQTKSRNYKSFSDNESVRCKKKDGLMVASVAGLLERAVYCKVQLLRQSVRKSGRTTMCGKCGRAFGLSLAVRLCRQASAFKVGMNLLVS